MRVHTAFFVSGFAALGGILLVLTNCGGDNTTTAEPVRGARKGEACQTTNDCVSGLSCVPNTRGTGNICVLGVFTVAQTAKECAITECNVAADCCPPPSSTCQQYADSCAAQLDAGLGDAGTACTLYETYCKCNNKDCENNKCITKCNTNTECLSTGLRVCAGGVCVQCGQDTDCTGGGNSTLKCISGVCKPPCQGDGDCPGFQRCLAGTCQEGACQTNRECVAYSRNVEATCATDGHCIVPCQTDLECGSPKDFKFYSCVSGQCLYLGCESDKDCRLILENPGSGSSSGTTSSSGITSSSSGSSSGFFTPTQHIVCRDKQTPGTKTIPAQ